MMMTMTMMMMETGKEGDDEHNSELVEQNLPCDDCGSSDALAVFTDGHTFCFACRTTHQPDSSGHVKGGRKDVPGTRKRKNMDIIEPGEPEHLPKRRISANTCRRFGYTCSSYKGRSCQVASYRDDTGSVVGQKLRFANKDFKVVGGSISKILFGQHLFRTGGKQIVITEGEIDALSLAEAWGKWPVVSLPQGAQSAKKAITANMEWLCSYERVILCFDQDEPGRAAAAEAAALFPPGKAYIAHLTRKDSSEMLQAGESKELVDSIWSAKPWRPDGLVGIDEAADRAMTPVTRGIDWPWPTLTEATYGIRRSEVYCLGAGTGIGKTDVFLQTVMHLASHKHPVGLFFLEQPVAETVRRLAGKLAGRRFHIPDAGWTAEEYVTAVDSLRTQDIHLFDHFGSSDWEHIKSRIRYLVQCYNVKDIFIDHLTAFAAHAADEKKALESIMADVASIAQELGCTIYMISHLSTPEGKPHEEGGRVTIRNFKGSRAIGFWSHMMFGLERDQQTENEEERNYTTFRVLKDRYTGNATGLTFKLRYDENTGLLSEADPTDPFNVDDRGFADESENDESTAFT